MFFITFNIFDGIAYPLGIGGDSDFVYGIKFDTEKSSFLYERSILEDVISGENKLLPICLYPDQSCSFDLDIKFQYLYKGKEKYIHCKKKDIVVNIDSSYLNEFKRDINITDQNDAYDNIEELFFTWPGQVMCSYPFDNYIDIKPKCPSCGYFLSYQTDLLNYFKANKFDIIWHCNFCGNDF